MCEVFAIRRSHTCTPPLCQESTARGGPSYGNSEINDMARSWREISLIPLEVHALDFLAVPEVSEEEQIDFSFPARY